MSARSRAGFRPVALFAVLLAFLAIAASGPARAIEIERVVSPGGIEAWLVRDKTVPLISVRFGFRGGSANEPADRAGLANLMTGLLDEGAGQMDSEAFQLALRDQAIKMSFDSSRDWFNGTLQTLSVNRDEAFRLLRLALNAPRFDDAPLRRIRSQTLVALRSDEQDPQDLARRAFMRLAFKDDVYARPQKGTFEALNAVTPDDLKSFSKKLFRKDGLKIAVVGDIDAVNLKRLLDETFGPLQKEVVFTDLPQAVVSPGPAIEVIDMDIPQTVIQFGSAGLKREDKDFVAAYVLNSILGGGGFSSRLYEEIREKRGLVYSVYSYLHPMARAGLFVGGAATQNGSVGEAIELIRSEIARLARDGPTARELDDAQRYLTGSFALRFDTGSKIAGQLLGTQKAALGIDYVEKRNSLIEAVTLEDVSRVAKRILKADDLIITLVGKPAGVKPVRGG